MYYAIVATLMVIFPWASVLVDRFVMHNADDLLLIIGKWFVFWAVGLRLFLAGLRQSTHPEFTARHIFEFKTDEPLPVIRELGFANLSIGLVAIVSLFQRAWLLPAALAGAVFYGLAGVMHVTHEKRNRVENVAMYTDLYASMVLLLTVYAAVRH